MKYILILFLFISANAAAQKPLILIDSFQAKGSFQEQVKSSMNRWHSRHKSNDLYTKNVDRKPKSINEDSIIYNVKFITPTSGKLLWNGKAKFYQSGNAIVCEVSQLVILKKSAMSGVDYVNMAADDMEDTMGNKINLINIKKEVKQFFKVIKK